MGYIVGRVMAETPEGRPSEIERLSLLLVSIGRAKSPRAKSLQNLLR